MYHTKVSQALPARFSMTGKLLYGYLGLGAVIRFI